MAKRDPDRTFASLREARALPGPDRGAPTPWEYPHDTFPNVKLRIHPPSASGEARRQLAIRVKFTTGEKKTEDRDSFLDFSELDKLKPKDAELRYQAAFNSAIKRIEEIDALRSASPEQRADAAQRADRMTVGDAWKRHSIETRLQRGPTTDKEVGNYERFYRHLENVYLDELSYKTYWSVFVGGLAEGKLLNADQLTWTKLPKKLVEATIIGIINLGAKLYTFAERVNGLGNKPKGWNPAGEARALVGTPNKRTGDIPLKHVAEVWRAADVLCASWARDHLRLYMLTGLRFSLLANLTFAEVDVKRRLLAISPHKKGTKRRGAKTPHNAPPLLIPISSTALSIIMARRQWAPDPDGPVWYSVRQPGGKAPKDGHKQIPTHSDPRTNWAHIEERVLGGIHFMRHDLRRTFARIAQRAGADLLGTSLLMLHSPRTVAKVMGLPDITLDYMNTPEAQEQMRSAANSIEKFVRGLLDGSIKLDAEPELELPSILEFAVGEEDDDE